MKKNIIIEVIVLITIIASIFIIYYIYKKLSDVVPPSSDSYKIVNYSKDKTIKYKKDLTEAFFYNFPETDKIIYESSSFEYYITATDNLINTITEVITLDYDTTNSEINKDQIINFCNSYDDIKSNYILKCTKQDNRLTIKNTYYLSKNYQETIKTRKYNISIPIKNGTKLDEYIEELNKSKIKFDYIQDFK